MLKSRCVFYLAVSRLPLFVQLAAASLRRRVERILQSRYCCGLPRKIVVRQTGSNQFNVLKPGSVGHRNAPPLMTCIPAPLKEDAIPEKVRVYSVRISIMKQRKISETCFYSTILVGAGAWVAQCSVLAISQSRWKGPQKDRGCPGAFLQQRFITAGLRRGPRPLPAINPSRNNRRPSQTVIASPTERNGQCQVKDVDGHFRLKGNWERKPLRRQE
jgi:hypothetical protein